jgi:DNA-directed RNA polymerase specialized sigma24 family protein
MNLPEFYEFYNTARPKLLTRVEPDARFDAEDALGDAVYKLLRQYRIRGEQSRIAKSTPDVMYAYLLRCLKVGLINQPGRSAYVVYENQITREGDFASAYENAADESVCDPEEILLAREAERERVGAQRVLTPIQTKVLLMLEDGMAHKAIAAALGISRQAVEKNLRAAEKKLAS